MWRVFVRERERGGGGEREPTWGVSSGPSRDAVFFGSLSLRPSVPPYLPLYNNNSQTPRGLGRDLTEHTHRHQTAVFRSGETCPEAGSKRALPSDKLGPSSKNRLPLWKWQVRWMTAASQEPPPTTTLGAPRERGCPLQPQKNGRSCRTSSTLQHTEVGPPERDKTDRLRETE